MILRVFCCYFVRAVEWKLGREIEFNSKKEIGDGDHVTSYYLKLEEAC